MKIGADLHKVICCIFLASSRTQRQDILSVKSIMSSCLASTWSCQDVLLRKIFVDTRVSF